MRVVMFIVALLLTAAIINAQPVITEVNSPQVGDIAIYVIDTLPDTSFKPITGPNVRWFINSIKTHDIDTIEYVDIATTGYDTSAVVASCDYAIKIGSQYLFVKKVRGSVNAEVGMAIGGIDPQTGEPTLAIATDPDTLALFPITYGDFFVDTGVYQTTRDTVILGSTQQILITITIIHIDSVNGYGMIYFPTGDSLSVLRIKNFRRLLIQATLGGIPIYNYAMNMLDANFITDGANYRYAVASVTFDLNKPDSVKAISTLKEFAGVPSGVEKASSMPVVSIIKSHKGIEVFTDGSEMTFELVSSEGKIIARSFGSYTVFSPPSEGLYILKATTKEGRKRAFKIDW